MRKSFRNAGFRSFLVAHVEKLLFAFAVMAATFLAWSGITNSGTAGLHAPQTPAMLMERAEKAQHHLEEFSWSDFKDLPERNGRANFKSRVDEAQQEIELSLIHI